MSDLMQVACARCGREYECTPTDDHYETLLWSAGRICTECLLILSGHDTIRYVEVDESFRLGIISNSDD